MFNQGASTIGTGMATLVTFYIEAAISVFILRHLIGRYALFQTTIDFFNTVTVFDAFLLYTLLNAIRKQIFKIDHKIMEQRTQQTTITHEHKEEEESKE